MSANQSLYWQLGRYEDYKSMEVQMKRFGETTHETAGGFYHRSIRLHLPGIDLEFHGPLVKAAEADSSVSTIDSSSLGITGVRDSIAKALGLTGEVELDDALASWALYSGEAGR